MGQIEKDTLPVFDDFANFLLPKEMLIDNAKAAVRNAISQIER